ncbi:MAG: helix-turn-helix transcriptional regulator [Pyrinomonadaceae bacterium]|nr:helix-turn-helix transcriptional regulator [Pyrinomonadaceae bacterium]
MLQVNKRETTSDRFANLFKRFEQSDAYHIDGAKLEISEQIYLAMEQQGVSNAELARRLGKSRAYITKVLQGNVNFTIESLVKIARALDHKFDFHFAPERETFRDAHLAETWQKNLRAPAFTRIGMKHKHEYAHIRLVHPSPNRTRESENATQSVAA